VIFCSHFSVCSRVSTARIGFATVGSSLPVSWIWSSCLKNSFPQLISLDLVSPFEDSSVYENQGPFSFLPSVTAPGHRFLRAHRPSLPPSRQGRAPGSAAGTCWSPKTKCIFLSDLFFDSAAGLLPFSLTDSVAATCAFQRRHQPPASGVPGQAVLPAPVRPLVSSIPADLGLQPSESSPDLDFCSSPFWNRVTLFVYQGEEPSWLDSFSVVVLLPVIHSDLISPLRPWLRPNVLGRQLVLRRG
jgi:hypothetical protein